MSFDKPSVRGRIRVPGDKSISHRALIFSLLTTGTSKISGLSPAHDCISSIDCLRQWGLKIESRIAENATLDSNSNFSTDTVLITSPGLSGLCVPQSVLFAGNSGTTIRLLAGVAAGQPFTSCFDGDDSLQKRPMSRILYPLMSMGAQVKWEKADGYAPFAISGGSLRGATFQIATSSAQVQTALLLAGLQANGETIVSVPSPVRDHTLRMFRHLGVPHKASVDGTTITVTKLTQPLSPYDLDVPSDISSCAFFMVAAALLPGSKVHLEKVGINPGRRLILDVLQSMGALITLDKLQEIAGEPIADVTVQWSGRLSGTTIGSDKIAAGIDEIPILALAGALSRGKFQVYGASELKVKESDRLAAIVNNLQAAGAAIKQYGDGFEVEGQETLVGGSLWQSFGDHRLAMTGLIANLIAEQPIEVDDTNCIAISYPAFQYNLGQLLKDQ